MLSYASRSPLYSLRIASNICFTVLAMASFQILAKVDPLQPTEEQIEVTPVIVSELTERHYRKVKLDNAFSERLFNAYLDNLDPARAFFLQQDIDQLTPLRKKLDNQLKNGDVSAGYDIYNIYRKRVVDRLNKVIELIENDFDTFDFSLDESLYIGDEKTAWLSSEKQADELWRKRVKHSILNLKVTDKSDEEIKELLIKRFNNRLHLSEQIKAEDVFEIYVNTYAALYDPHTSYYSPRSTEYLKKRKRLSQEVIGLVLSQNGEFTRVDRLVKGGPAVLQSGIQRGDLVVSVGEGLDNELVNVLGWRLDDVVDLMRGPRDSWVRLEVISAEPDDPKKTRVIQIRRGKVELEEETASKQILEIKRNGRPYKVGVIEIPAFYIDFQAFRNGDANYRSATRDVSRLLQELEQEQVEGLVIDLRDNGGGALLEVNRLTALFIENGPIVQIRHANNRVERQGKVKKTSYYEKPLVVLTNRLSAAASEIFAGVIQDYQRGLVVGGRSFGKGTMQALSPLPHGLLKITQSKFYRISGKSTQLYGVTPDILFPAIYDPEILGESTLKGALEWDTVKSMEQDYYGDLVAIKPELTKRHQSRRAENPEFRYLTERLTLNQKTRSQESVTLNEMDRLAERDKLSNQYSAIERRFWDANGKKPPTSAGELSEAVTSSMSDQTMKIAEQLYLLEAAEILLDTSELNGITGRVRRK